MNFKEYTQLMEGVYDPSIFKAIFLAGGPGSGKSFIVGKTSLASLGFVLINSDVAFEHLMVKLGLDFKMPDSEQDQRDMAREAAKATIDKKMTLALNGRLGLVIDGTGKDYDKIERMKKKLAEKGYDSAMIFVNTDLDTSLKRNAQRWRSLQPELAKQLWKAVQNNLGKFQSEFGNEFFMIDNSEGSDYAPQVLRVYKRISQWSKAAPHNNVAINWIKSEKESKLKEDTLVEYRFKNAHYDEWNQLKADGYEHAKSGGVGHPAYSKLYMQTVNKYAEVPLKNRVHFSNAWVTGFKDFINQSKDTQQPETDDLQESMGIWSYNDASGLWKHEREVNATTADKWLHIYKSDEPKKSFVLSSKKPKGKPQSVEEAKKEMKDEDPCWDNYEMVGFKKKNGKKVPNCVPKNESLDEVSSEDKGEYDYEGAMSIT